MEENRSAIQYKEGQISLFDSSYRAIPFNIVLAIFLAISLLYNKLPGIITFSWLSALIIISAIRMIHCKLVIDKNLLENSANFNLKLLMVLNGLAGLIWASIYFAALGHTDKLQLYLIVLVCGGMAAGSTASLGIYLPAFFVYILAIFLPIIIYNYSLWDVNDAIFASMFVWFLMALTIIARSHQKLFANTFFLTAQNKELVCKYEMLSITDALTDLYNRRHFNKIFLDEYNRAKRNKQPFALVTIDIDNFKLVNDNLGHPFGDQFLIYFADYLKFYFKRANDIIFRVGGDEFAALLINVSEKSAQTICEQIRGEFLKNPGFEYKPRDNLHQTVLGQVSLSIGITYVPYEASATIEQIIAIADMTLYQSKHGGKNQISYLKCM
jgi:diguanylate cyclase (GGDEF)-like protein